MSKIQQSKNYDKFQIHEFNRDVTNTKVLEESMEKYGWIDAYPMYVVNNSDKYTVKDGHHRFTAAQKLGIPVKYVVCKNDDITIPELQGATNHWSALDYLISYDRMGIYDYNHVYQYMRQTGLPVMICVSVCSGESAGSANHLEKFKSGTYRLGDQTHAEQLKEAVTALAKIGVDFVTNSKFAKALSKALRVPEFNLKLFIGRAKKNKASIEKQPNVEKYLEMIEAIYNKGARCNAIPLVFMANEEAKRRSVSNLQ